MHIASAFNKTIISIWGNTVPQFGMSPYKPNVLSKIFENDYQGKVCSYRW
jgi:ADP-heptose:LPS heptosyltransferase